MARGSLVAGTYIVIHTIVILVQATTLSVAINSHSKALLTIMVSNNFVELKGSVFKKFEIRNLFQMSCSGELLAGKMLEGWVGGAWLLYPISYAKISYFLQSVPLLVLAG